MRGKTCPYLFAYGTLRRGAEKDLLDFVEALGGLTSRTKFLGRATVPGRLYDLGEYPGMLDGAKQGDLVFGEVYELGDVESVLNRLDDYEGCGVNGDGAFRRALKKVLADGESLDAWVYLYEGEVSEQQRIVSGDYFRPTD